MEEKREKFSHNGNDYIVKTEMVARPRSIDEVGFAVYVDGLKDLLYADTGDIVFGDERAEAIAAYEARQLG